MKTDDKEALIACGLMLGAMVGACTTLCEYENRTVPATIVNIDSRSALGVQLHSTKNMISGMTLFSTVMVTSICLYKLFNKYS